MSHPTDPRLLSARTEFTNAFGDLARGKRNWQLTASWLLGLLTLVIVAYVRLASTTHVVPYVIEVDRLGQVATSGAIEAMKEPEPRLVASQLAGFVRAVRTVLPAAPPQLEAEVMRQAYGFVDQTSTAASTLNAYFADPLHDPRILGRTLTREVHVMSTLLLPGTSTWKIRWTEMDLPLAVGVLTRTTAWEGYVTVRLHPPQTADAVRDNPLGVFITSINWTEITDTGGATS
jgi:type IV secretory pathway TrbF-like protein